ncbi:MAG: DUF4352 domain-containing protein [Acidaminococcaceae bacterium]|nr:DUF4352 domain-containing protein [Acidaminococcaceae bacterium]
MIRRMILILAVVALFFVTGCGGGNSNAKKDPTKVLGINGVNYIAYNSSDVDIAITNLTTAKSIGSNPYFKKKAMGKFVLVDVFINNNQKDAITVDSSSFKILDNQKREFSKSVEGETALQMEKGDNKGFLTQLNPGMNTTFTFVYDVPENLDLNTANLEARGGFGGSKVVIPLKVQKK